MIDRAAISCDRPIEGHMVTMAPGYHAGARAITIGWNPKLAETAMIGNSRFRRAGLTQTRLAERIGRSQRFISRVERGLHRVTVVELIDFGAALDFDAAAALRRVAKAAKR